ncbi:MAG TPA: ATP-binding protein [Acidimicrobiales bacterium]|jgi:DNA polymerase-3 subunit delta'|nr:ATP-binding protein [Acidimicrobiales bacterium]
MPDLFDDVIGQSRAVAALRASAARPVHAYLLVGPAGTGKAAAAISFAAALLCPTAGDHTGHPGHTGHPDHPGHPDHTGHPDDDLCDTCRRVVSGLHPDVLHVEREGASIAVGAAREVTRLAFMSPVEGARKVIVLHDFHLVKETGPALLKTIEEPPPTTVFIVLAEYLPPELVTIASRCVRVDFDALGPAHVVDALVAAGVERDRAVHLAEAAGGRLERARLLATDPQFETRRQAWHSIPARLDGTGATVAQVADELVALLDQSVAPLKERQAAETEALMERNRRNAEVVASGRAAKKGRATKSALNAGVADLEDRHKREQRRQRTDELRTGLATLALAYRGRIADARTRGPALDAVSQIDRSVKSLEFNPGELLLLQALLARLSQVTPG